ncbi:MAG: GGDEF domain-containing protein [Pseudomonadota bacterium]
MKVTSPRAARPARQSAGATSAAEPAGDGAPPAQRITDTVNIAGVPDAELTPRVRKALFSLLEEVSDLRRELQEARDQLAELKTLANADPLLGINNRRAFVQELDRALALVQRYGTPASLVFIDLNDLKLINDRLGHAAGDAALAHVSSIVEKNIRATDTFGRLGGDEFGLILMMTEEDVAQEKAESLRQAVATAPIELDGAPRRLGIACGVVPLRPMKTAEEAIDAADAKMYARKRETKAAQG